MMFKKIDVSVDTFAWLWSARRADENSEEEIIVRLLKEADGVAMARNPSDNRVRTDGPPDSPPAGDWVTMLLWALKALGGTATLKEIYGKTREGRRALGMRITRNHDASVRERLEAHCRESESFKGGRNLFCMPNGKGAGVWAIR